MSDTGFQISRAARKHLVLYSFASHSVVSGPPSSPAPASLWALAGDFQALPCTYRMRQPGGGAQQSVFY